MRLGALPLDPEQVGGHLGALGFRGRRRAFLHALLQLRYQLIEARNLFVEDFDPALRADDGNEGDRGLGQHLQPCRPPLPDRGTDTGLACGNAGFALAAEFD